MSVVEVSQRVLTRPKKSAVCHNKKRKKIYLTGQDVTASTKTTSAPQQHPLAEVMGYLKGDIWEEIRQERELERQERDRLALLE